MSPELALGMSGYGEIFDPKFRKQVGLVSLPGVSGIAVFTTAACLQRRKGDKTA
jgi:hypothetical protein